MKDVNAANMQKLTEQAAKYESLMTERRQLHKVELEAAHKALTDKKNEMVMTVTSMFNEATNMK